MNPHRRQLFVAAALLAAGTLAHAQLPAAGETSGPAAGRMRHRHPEGKRRFSHDAERHARRQQAFKDELKLSEAQQPAWERYQQAMQPQAGAGARQQPEDLSGLSTPERLDRMQARQAERQQRMEQRMQAVRDFYVELTPEQQKIFDERARRRGRGDKFMRQPKA